MLTSVTQGGRLNPKTHHLVARREDQRVSMGNSLWDMCVAHEPIAITLFLESPIRMAMEWPHQLCLHDLTLAFWPLLIGARVDNCPQMTDETLLLSSADGFSWVGEVGMRGEDSPKCPFTGSHLASPRWLATSPSGVRKTSIWSKPLVSIFVTSPVSCLKLTCAVQQVQ